MIGPVSSTGRSMMASLQQAIQKGMPPDQAIAYVKGMATQGVAPLTDLYTMLNQFQRLKQQQVQPPQTPPTIKDSLNQMDMQQRMQAAQPQVQPMDRGLGGIDAGRMQYPQFAGGGIVAFEDGGFITGGPVKDNPRNDPLYPEQTLRQLREQAGVYDPADMSEADKFRFYGMPMEPSAPPSDRDTFGYALNRVATDPAAVGAGLGALVGGPIGIPIGGYLGGYLGRTVGKAEGGVIHMAQGTPKNTVQDPWYQPAASFFGDVARGFAPAGAGPYGEVSPFQTEEMYDLSSSPDVSNDQLIAAYRKAVKESDPKAEQLGQILLNRNLSKEVERVNLELAPNKATSAAARATALGQNLNLIPSATPPAPAAPAAKKVEAVKPAGTGLGGNYGDFSKYRTEAGKLRTAAETEANLTAMQRAQASQKDLDALGIGESAKRRGEYLTQREAEAEKELGQDKRMALAQAGFAMAEAASRRGRERTGFLGAAAIGGTTGTKLYQAALKENRALKNSIADNRFALEQAQEQMKLGNYREGAAQAREAKQNLANLNQALAANELGIDKFRGEQAGMDRRTFAELEANKSYRDELTRLKREELNVKKLAQVALMPDKEQREKALMALLGGISGGEDVDDLVAKYR